MVISAKPLVKACIVLAGYAGAFMLAVAAVSLRMRANAGNPDVDTSGGMYAFGDSLIFIFTFGITALVPTAAALYFARSRQWFWNALAVGALALASTNVLAAIVYWTERFRVLAGATFDMWAALAILRMIVAPLVAAACVVCAQFSLQPAARRALRIAGAIELAASLPWLIWIVQQRFTAH